LLGESLGSLTLLAGFLTRFTAASLTFIMLGAITMVQLTHRLFMNWFGQQQGKVMRIIYWSWGWRPRS